jgi:hypothetical protein
VIVKLIVQQRLSDTYNFGLIDTNTAIRINTFSVQSPDILIEDTNVIKIANTRCGVTIRISATAVPRHYFLQNGNATLMRLIGTSTADRHICRGHYICSRWCSCIK